jgi:hypothetical protein
VPSAAARAQVRDYGLKLLLPRFLRELALGWIETADHDTVDDGVGRLRLLADELEQALPETVGYRCEPNYLLVIYDCLLDGLARAGQDAEQASVQRRRDELPARVAALVQEL